MKFQKAIAKLCLVLTAIGAGQKVWAGVARMKITSAAQTLPVNQCSSAVKVQALNYRDRVTNVPSNTSLFFEQGSPELVIFKDAGCTTQVSKVVMRAGTSSATFYFRATSSGDKSLRVSTFNYEDDTQIERVTMSGTPSDPMPEPQQPPQPPPPTNPAPNPNTTGRLVPSPMYGVTIDDVTNINGMISVLKTFPYMTTSRIVLDPGTKPSDYTAAMTSLRPTSYIMAELQDSADMKNQTVSSYQSRASTYFSSLKGLVDIWEVGNEINGDWLGTDVENKLRAGFKVIDEAGGQTAITFFYFGETGKPNCIPGARYEMFTWINNLLQLNLPPEQRDPANEKMRLNLDYALVSWYPQQCGDIKPDWASVFQRLAAIFPNAKVGMGEIGTANPQNGSSYELNLIKEFYPLGSRVMMPSSYIGGYFWWYFAEEYKNTSIVETLKSSILQGPKP